MNENQETQQIQQEHPLMEFLVLLPAEKADKLIELFYEEIANSHIKGLNKSLEIYQNSISLTDKN